jgi:hypothetical protein
MKYLILLSLIFAPLNKTAVFYAPTFEEYEVQRDNLLDFYGKIYNEYGINVQYIKSDSIHYQIISNENNGAAPPRA